MSAPVRRSGRPGKRRRDNLGTPNQALHLTGRAGRPSLICSSLGPPAAEQVVRRRARTEGSTALDELAERLDGNSSYLGLCRVHREDLAHGGGRE